jgi:hypothetical protein
MAYRLDKGPWQRVTNVPIGGKGDRNPYVDVYSLGICTEIEFKISEMQDYDFLLSSMLITYEELG